MRRSEVYSSRVIVSSLASLIQKIGWLGGSIVKGVGLPFFVSGIMGLLALALPLVFVKEPRRKGDVDKKSLNF